MKNVVKAFSVAIIALFAMIMLPSVNAFASTASGNCGVDGGDNVTWELDGGVLTISGTGEMADYENVSDVPWNSYKTNINSVVVSEGVENIGDDAFYSLTSLESATIAGSVTSIGWCAFGNCKKLKDVTFQGESKLTNIGIHCFYRCHALESIVIPSTVETIEEYVFSECKVVEIEVDKNNTNYASYKGALYSKDKKTLITAAGAGAVEGFEIAPETVTIGLRAFGDATITEITIPKSVKEIWAGAFEYSSVETVAFEEGSEIEAIGREIFYNCKALSSITIPEGVTGVGSYAFCDCSSLKTIIVLSSQISIGSKCFENCSPDLVIYPDEADYDINSWGFDSVDSVLTYVESEDTITLKVKETSNTNIKIPESINGKRVTSISFAEGISTDNITIECETCYKTDSSYDMEGHFDVCGVCKGEVDKENHSFGDGDDACKCGYVPYTVKSVSDALATTYGSTKGQTLSVDVDTTLGTEVVTYKWYLDGVELEGATSDAYVIPDNM
ncbi:MAG: leucine-rich repeat domain-containing protein, partial [Lachnospiraceae bacterium]|nr:leucine-rich repeat domain-containing protein [Lachnospiraceae bacterium]